MVTNNTAIVPYDPTGETPVQASSDDQMIELWLGRFRSPHTIRAFGNDIHHFPARPCRSRCGGHPAGHPGLGTWRWKAVHRAEERRQRRLTTRPRSLFAFAHRIGYLRFNVAAAVTTPPIEDRLAQRIPTERADGEAARRPRRPSGQRCCSRLLYIAGLRISEASGLRWRHLTPRDAGEVQLSIFGKGGRTRPIVIPATMAARLFALKQRTDGPDDPVFRSRSLARRGVAMGPRDIWVTVKKAVQRADLPREFTSHHLRHAHAKPRAPIAARRIHIVQATARPRQSDHHHRALHARQARRFASAKYLPT